jgi:hypothetical protein
LNFAILSGFLNTVPGALDAILAALNASPAKIALLN